MPSSRPCRRIEEPGFQHAVLDNGEALSADAFAVERMRTLPARDQRIVDDADAGRENLLAQLLAQETRLARHRCAVGGAGEMTDQRARDARIENHRAPCVVDTLRGLTRLTVRSPAIVPTCCRRIEIGRMRLGGEFVVALHAGAFAGDRHHRERMPRAEIGARETVARDQHHAADTGRGRGAAGLGHALDRKPGRFGLARELFQMRGRGNLRIDQIEIGKFLRQALGIGEAGIRIVRRHARHGDRAFGQGGRSGALDVIGRHHRLLAPDEDAQAEIVAFGALGFLDRAVAHFDAGRNRTHRDRVGRSAPALRAAATRLSARSVRVD